MSRKMSRKKRREMIGTILLTILIGIAAATEPGRELLREVFQESSDAEADEATVERVVDGDTLVVDLNGEETKVRLIGVNTPESVSPDESRNCKEGEEASEFTKDYLPEGTKVYLEYDEEREDKYGRTLAYVWLTDDCDYWDYEDFCKYNLGAVLMQNTYCEAVYYKPNGKYREWYEQLEQEYQDVQNEK